MALNWDISKCQNYKELNSDSEWPITNAIIWATMAVYLGDITQTNYKEFYRRLHQSELKGGTYLMQNGKPLYITEEQVRRRIGLRTNVSNWSRSKYDAFQKKKASAAI